MIFDDGGRSAMPECRADTIVETGEGQTRELLYGWHPALLGIHITAGIAFSESSLHTQLEIF